MRFHKVKLTKNFDGKASSLWYGPWWWVVSKGDYEQLKWANHECPTLPAFARHTRAGSAIALHFVYYNFCKIHKTIRVTPVMEAGLTKHVMTIEEIIKLSE
jgi:hypothetical protein